MIDDMKYDTNQRAGLLEENQACTFSDVDLHTSIEEESRAPKTLAPFMARSMQHIRKETLQWLSV